jgi:hypothetical protein
VKEVLERWSNDIPGTLGTLKKAKDDATTPEAKRLINELNFALVMSTGGIAFTPATRRGARQQILAMSYWCGAPTTYATISPADMDTRMGQMMVGGMRDPATDTMPPYSERLSKMTEMPAASSETFYAMTRVVIKHMVGLPSGANEYRVSPPASSRPVGIFGTRHPRLPLWIERSAHFLTRLWQQLRDARQKTWKKARAKATRKSHLVSFCFLAARGPAKHLCATPSPTQSTQSRRIKASFVARAPASPQRWLAGKRSTQP